MCHIIVEGGFPSRYWGGGSRSLRSGLVRVGLRERSHFTRFGVVLCPVLSDHREFLSGALFPDSTIVLEGIM